MGTGVSALVRRGYPKVSAPTIPFPQKEKLTERSSQRGGRQFAE